MKIGMYTEDEILEHLTEGEGRGFLGRSMYDAIFDKIHALITENEQLKKENEKLRKQNTELKDNWNKLKEWIKEDTEVAETNFEMGRCFNMYDLLNKMQEIEGGMNE